MIMTYKHTSFRIHMIVQLTYPVQHVSVACLQECRVNF